MLSDDTIAELRALNEARKHGDWTVMWLTVNGQEFPTSIHACDVDADEDGNAKDYGADICDIADTEHDEANAAFIVAFANHASALLDAAEEGKRLRRERNTWLREMENLRGTLRFVRAALPVLRTMCEVAKLREGAAKAQEMLLAVDDALPPALSEQTP